MRQNILLTILLLSSSLTAQEIIFPGLNGDSLFKAIIQFYTPQKVLSYDEARIKLYTEVFLQNDSIECFYSGYKVHIIDKAKILPLTAKLGIQTEHLFPRSFGSASLPALGDLHHLVPTQASINALRRNAIFQDIPDNQTKYWLYKDKILTTIPKSNISLYSESTTKAFEPPEERKGDIARSMFYFYTIYKSDADRKSKTFFSSMLPDLCRWHQMDRVDSVEYKRTLAIGRIQSNINPFVIDPTLAERCFCTAYLDKPTITYSVNIYPNPSKGLFYIDIPDYKGPVVMTISTLSGKLLEKHYLMYSGLMSWRLGSGVYELHFEINKNYYHSDYILVY